MEHTEWSILRNHTFQIACVSGLLGAFIPQTETGTLQSLIQQSTAASDRTLLQTAQTHRGPRDLSDPLVKDRHTYLHTPFRASREFLNIQLSFRASREIFGTFKIRSEHR